MKDFVIKCSARSEEQGDIEPGYLTLRFAPEPIGRRTTQAIPLENTTRRMQHDGGTYGAEGEVNESRGER